MLMKNILFGLICIGVFTACPRIPRLPQAISVTIENPQPNAGACPDGVQVTLTKGTNSWTSPLVTETRFGFGVSPPSSEYGYFFTGDPKIDVSILCKKGSETGVFKAIRQTTGFIISIYVYTGKPYQTLDIDGLSTVSISQANLPLPEISFGSY
jgi:hypothetical protein